MANEEIRRTIPTELRRRVLVEAGHRCAIHTCRYPDVDVHHIEPWAKVREHRFDDLIALCSNCHRRADAREIDRKSLYMYKARLAAAFRFAESHTYPDEPPAAPEFGWLDSRTRWVTLVERDSDEKRNYGAQIEYPKFSGLRVDFEPLNDFVAKMVTRSIYKFRADVVDSPTFDDSRSTLGMGINSSFAVSLLSKDLVSIRFTFYAYTGGAHGSTWTEPVNAFLAPFAPISLESLFADVSLGVEVLSRYCVRTLLDPSMPGHQRDKSCVGRGAGPEPKHFRSFNLTKYGILITFDEYQIGSFAEGPSEVLVPFSVIGDNLTEPLRKIVVPE